MKIHNVRLGHATNSSSSHSIIFDPDLVDDYDNDGFGWNFFTAASTEVKKQYMACILKHNFQLPASLVTMMLRALDLPEITEDIGIDHQSMFQIPTEIGEKIPSVEFFTEFSDYLLQKGVVILGGNDNDDSSHPSFDSSKQIDLNGYTTESTYVCRKDGDWWTLFNTNNGNRVVLSFKDDPVEFKPEAPMLVDMKVTDYCSMGCDYCYQGSTTNGKHMSDVYWYVERLKNAKVFEVAIGGGEPTEFKDFRSLVEMLHEAGISVNFTTKKVDWLYQPGARELLLNIGAFAYSVDPNTKIPLLDSIKNRIKALGVPTEKFTIQVIPALFTDGEKLKEVLDWAYHAYVRVTLLGYKSTVRGKLFVENGNLLETEQNWIQLLNSSKNVPRLSIDTTLAHRYQHSLNDLDIPTWLYHVEEGKYSMYIDAVANKYGPSSYHIDDLKPLKVYDTDLKTCFSDMVVR
jgi:hypothetical protein